MKFFYSTCGVLVLFLTLMGITSCSGKGTPVTQSEKQTDISIGLEDQGECDRSVIGVYDARIDPMAKTFIVTPDNRSGMYHFPISNYFNVIKIMGYGWTPNLWADIKLTHPYPGSGITVFDPRVIAIIPANPGVSFNYPVMNASANNAVVMSPDGYTKLFDTLGGHLPGNANPFKAYFKAEPYHQWSSTGAISETQRWDLNLAGFGGAMQFKLVVDISTKYSRPSTPIFDNANEPVQITARVRSGLTPDGGIAQAIATVMDWQGKYDVSVKVEAPALFDGALQLPYTGAGPGEYDLKYEASISNYKHVADGNYPVLFGAGDDVTNTYIYYETTATVESVLVPGTPEIIKINESNPNLVAKDIAIKDQYAYITGSEGETSAFCVVNIEPPDFPYIPYVVASIDVKTENVDVSGDLVYTGCLDEGVRIFDTFPPEVFNQRGWVQDATDAHNIRVQGSYAYVAAGLEGLKVLNIEPPESAEVLGSFWDSGSYLGVDAINNEYVFVASLDGLKIFNVDTEGHPTLVNEIGMGEEQVRISGNYAYTVGDYLQVVDITNPEAASESAHLNISSGNGHDVCISRGYAFVTTYGLLIFDIDPLEDAHIEAAVSLPGEKAYGIDIKGDYVYIADGDAGLCIVKVF